MVPPFPASLMNFQPGRALIKRPFSKNGLRVIAMSDCTRSFFRSLTRFRVPSPLPPHHDVIRQGRVEEGEGEGRQVRTVIN